MPGVFPSPWLLNSALHLFYTLVFASFQHNELLQVKYDCYCPFFFFSVPRMISVRYHFWHILHWRLLCFLHSTFVNPLSVLYVDTSFRTAPSSLQETFHCETVNMLVLLSSCLLQNVYASRGSLVIIISLSSLFDFVACTYIHGIKYES